MAVIKIAFKKLLNVLVLPLSFMLMASIAHAQPAPVTNLIVTQTGSNSFDLALTFPDAAVIGGVDYRLNNGSWNAIYPTAGGASVVGQSISAGTQAVANILTNPALTAGTYTVDIRYSTGTPVNGGFVADPASVSFTVASSNTAPAAPTALTAAAGDASATITFTAGADGGAAITNYGVVALPRPEA